MEGIICFSLLRSNGNLTAHTLLQGDECLGGYHTRNVLQLIVEQVHQLLIVTGKEFHKHRVRTGSEMAFHYLGNMHETLNDLLVHRTALKRNAYVGAGTVTQRLGIHIETGACDDTIVNQMLYTLMNGGTGNAALCCHILERDARILRQDIQYLSVQIVYLFHCYG